MRTVILYLCMYLSISFALRLNSFIKVRGEKHRPLRNSFNHEIDLEPKAYNIFNVGKPKQQVTTKNKGYNNINKNAEPFDSFAVKITNLNQKWSVNKPLNVDDNVFKIAKNTFDRQKPKNVKVMNNEYLCQSKFLALCSGKGGKETSKENMAKENSNKNVGIKALFYKPRWALALRQNLRKCNNINLKICAIIDNRQGHNIVLQEIKPQDLFGQSAVSSPWHYDASYKDNDIIVDNKPSTTPSRIADQSTTATSCNGESLDGDDDVSFCNYNYDQGKDDKNIADNNFVHKTAILSPSSDNRSCTVKVVVKENGNEVSIYERPCSKGWDTKPLSHEVAPTTTVNPWYGLLKEDDSDDESDEENDNDTNESDESSEYDDGGKDYDDDDDESIEYEIKLEKPNEKGNLDKKKVDNVKTTNSPGMTAMPPWEDDEDSLRAGTRSESEAPPVCEPKKCFVDCLPKGGVCHKNECTCLQ